MEGFLRLAPDVLAYAELLTLRVRVFPPNGCVYVYTSSAPTPAVICRGEHTFTVGLTHGGVFMRAAEGEDFSVELVSWSRGFRRVDVRFDVTPARRHRAPAPAPRRSFLSRLVYT